MFLLTATSSSSSSCCSHRWSKPLLAFALIKLLQVRNISMPRLKAHFAVHALYQIYLGFYGADSQSTLQWLCISNLKPNTHRRRRRDETVESRRVGGVYTNSQLVGDSFVVSSVWTHPSAVVTRIVNWPPTAVLCIRIRRQSSRIHVHTANADATRQNSFVSSAVCIGLYH